MKWIALLCVFCASAFAIEPVGDSADPRRLSFMVTAANTVPEKIPNRAWPTTGFTWSQSAAPLMTFKATAELMISCQHGYVTFKPDGTVRYRNCKPSEAAKQFWKAIGSAYPSATNCDKEFTLWPGQKENPK